LIIYNLIVGYCLLLQAKIISLTSDKPKCIQC